MSRSIKKGPFVEARLLGRIEEMNKRSEKKVVKTWSRASVIFPTFIGHTVAVYNGRKRVTVYVTENMVGHRFGEFATVRLPSGEMRRVPLRCMATVGQVSNLDHENQNLGKAGRARHLGQRPEVRGVVMNPRDHPHGGGEGKSPTGMPPKTPWGKPAMGYRTRRSKTTGRLIVRSRHRK